MIIDHPMKKILLLLFILITLSYTGQAQDSLKLTVKRLGADDILAPHNPSDVKVVTASRSGQSIANLPITVHVITKQEISLHGYTTLVDVLKSVPGMKTSKPGSGFEGETFIMRGLVGNSYTKILINGISVQPSVKGTVGIGEQLPITQAERIEVIYGPASSVYGSDAMAGVINIITQKADNGTLAHANIMVGTDNYRHLDFMVGGKAGKNKNVFQYLIYGNTAQREDLNINQSSSVFNTRDYFIEELADNPFEGLPQAAIDNILAMTDEQLVNHYQSLGAAPKYKGTGTIPVVEEYPHQSYALGLKLNYQNFQFTFDEMYRRDHSSLGREPLFFSHADPGNFIGERVQRTALNYQNSWEKFSLTANASYLRYRMDFLSSIGGNYSTGFAGPSHLFEASDDIFVEGLLNYTPNKRWNLLFGTAYQRSGSLPLTNDLDDFFEVDHYKPFSTQKPPAHPTYGDFGFNPQSYSTTSLFFQAYHNKGGRFSWMGGFRLERSSNYDIEEIIRTVGFAPIPSTIRLGTVYKINDKASLRASISSGFRAPPPSLQYASLALPSYDDSGNIQPDSVNYQRLPNESLVPETSFVFELGYRHAFSDHYYLDVSFFHNQISNSINPEVLPVNRSLYPDAAINTVFLNRGFALARTNLNDSESERSISGLQFIFRGKDILPKYKASFDLYLTLSGGFENFPDLTLPDQVVEGGSIERLRGMPSTIAQFNVSFKPNRNWYFRLENVYMSSWIRRGVLTESQVSNELFFPETSGFYNLDVIARYQISKNLQGFMRVINVLNKDYGGIGATGLDVDLFYNPQLLRNIQFGITFTK